MKPEETDIQTGRRKGWLIVFSASIFLLAVFWSVDASVFYILTGFSVFSFYQFLKNRNSEPEPVKAYSHSPIFAFWDEVKALFNKSEPVHDPRRQSTLVAFVIAAASGFILLVR